MGKDETTYYPPVTYPVDKKSRQVVNREIPVAQLGRTKVKGSDPFNEYAANEALEKHLKKKPKSAPVMFLVDRARFTKKGFHEYLSYREVNHFHRFQHHPDKFLLYVIEEKKGKRAYETYACQKPEDVQTIRDMIAAAHNDPRRLLQDYGPTRLLSLSSSSSSEYYVENKKPMRRSRPPSMVMVEPNNYVSQPQYVIERRPSYGQPSYRPVTTNSYLPQQSYPQTYQRRQSMAPNDITYLQPDSIYGPEIRDSGPVYMYVSRSRPNSESRRSYY